MKLTVTIIMISLSLTSLARQPAVESFVGVEPSSYVNRAPSSEKPFNFEKVEVKPEAAKAPKMIKAESQAAGFTLPYFSILSLLITLPFAVWQMVMGSLGKKKASSNVVNFPKAKKDDDEDDDQWNKKAS